MVARTQCLAALVAVAAAVRQSAASLPPVPSLAAEHHRSAQEATRQLRAEKLERSPPGGIDSDPYPGYQLRTYTQRVDHFNFENNHGNWSQRYLISTAPWQPSAGGPVMFFTGAEGGDITRLYSYAYGYARAVAQELGALIVFMEHRFFGKSFPYNTANASDRNAVDGLGVLSVEQGLADYAEIITFVLNSKKAWANPTMTFGGSLAGTLAALMRVRYPYLVDMAWASSTPLLGYPGLASQYAWRKQITDNFEAFSPGCPDIVRKGFRGIINVSSKELHSAIPVCEAPDKFTWNDVQAVAWGVLESDGEFCYPPAYSQIKQHCSAMSRGGTGPKVFVELVKTGARNYWSQKGNCLNITQYKAAGHSPDATGWNYLASTTIVHPIGANNATDMFPPYIWTVDDTTYWARKNFNVSTDAQHIPEQFGMVRLKSFARVNSRILFAYGLRDPWHTLGVGTKDLSSTLPVVTIADGSHCADMVLPDKSVDSAAMVTARGKILSQLRSWVDTARSEKKLLMNYT